MRSKKRSHTYMLIYNADGYFPVFHAGVDTIRLEVTVRE